VSVSSPSHPTMVHHLPFPRHPDFLRRWRGALSWWRGSRRVDSTRVSFAGPLFLQGTTHDSTLFIFERIALAGASMSLNFLPDFLYANLFLSPHSPG